MTTPSLPPPPSSSLLLPCPFSSSTGVCRRIGYWFQHLLCLLEYPIHLLHHLLLLILSSLLFPIATCCPTTLLPPLTKQYAHSFLHLNLYNTTFGAILCAALTPWSLPYWLVPDVEVRREGRRWW